MATFKIYRRHNCSAVHRSYNDFATCAFPRAAWVDGEGPFALVAWCGAVRVFLHPTGPSALAAQEEMDRTGCSSWKCWGRHQVVQLLLGPYEP